MVKGILGAQTPVITGIARHNVKEDGESWATAKRIYRLLMTVRVHATPIIFQ